MKNLYKEILPGDVHEKINKGEDILIIDVREPDEWEAGHIKVAKHIPLGQLAERLHELDPNKEIVMVCRSGARSGMACDYLSELGYKVINMTGGMIKWIGDIETGK